MGFGQKPALLLIDLYRWVFGDQPQPLVEQIREWPGSCGLAGWNAIPHIQRLLSASRKAGSTSSPSFSSSSTAFWRTPKRRPSRSFSSRATSPESATADPLPCSLAGLAECNVRL